MNVNQHVINTLFFSFHIFVFFFFIKDTNYVYICMSVQDSRLYKNALF